MQKKRSLAWTTNELSMQSKHSTKMPMITKISIPVVLTDKNCGRAPEPWTTCGLGYGHPACETNRTCSNNLQRNIFFPPNIPFLYLIIIIKKNKKSRFRFDSTKRSSMCQISNYFLGLDQISNFKAKLFRTIELRTSCRLRLQTNYKHFCILIR